LFGWFTQVGFTAWRTIAAGLHAWILPFYSSRTYTPRFAHGCTFLPVYVAALHMRFSIPRPVPPARLVLLPTGSAVLRFTAPGSVPSCSSFWLPAAIATTRLVAVPLPATYRLVPHLPHPVLAHTQFTHTFHTPHTHTCPHLGCYRLHTDCTHTHHTQVAVLLPLVTTHLYYTHTFHHTYHTLVTYHTLQFLCTHVTFPHMDLWLSVNSQVGMGAEWMFACARCPLPLPTITQLNSTDSRSHTLLLFVLHTLWVGGWMNMGGWSCLEVRSSYGYGLQICYGFFLLVPHACLGWWVALHGPLYPHHTFGLPGYCCRTGCSLRFTLPFPFGILHSSHTVPIPPPGLPQLPPYPTQFSPTTHPFLLWCSSHPAVATVWIPTITVTFTYTHRLDSSSAFPHTRFWT